MGVEQVVRGMAAGFLQVLFVQSLDLGVFVRTTDGIICIGLVHLPHTFGNRTA